MIKKGLAFPAVLFYADWDWAGRFGSWLPNDLNMTQREIQARRETYGDRSRQSSRARHTMQAYTGDNKLTRLVLKPRFGAGLPVSVTGSNYR